MAAPEKACAAGISCFCGGFCSCLCCCSLFFFCSRCLICDSEGALLPVPESRRKSALCPARSRSIVVSLAALVLDEPDNREDTDSRLSPEAASTKNEDGVACTQDEHSEDYFARPLHWRFASPTGHYDEETAAAAAVEEARYHRHRTEDWDDRKRGLPPIIVTVPTSPLPCAPPLN